MMSHTYSLYIFYPIVLSFVAVVSTLGFSLFFILLVSFLFTLRLFRVPRVAKSAIHDFFGEKSKPLLIAHRGAALDAPENTLEAFKLAYQNGANAIEFDLEFTRDSEPVIIHDDTVDRTTDGEGEISSFTLEDIQKLDAGAKFEPRRQFGRVKIPTLEEAIVLCLKLKMKMFIDCKRNAKLTAKCLGRLFMKYPALYKEAIVCSFFPQIIYKVRKVDPKIVTALTFKHQFLATNLNPQSLKWWHQILACIGDILLETAHHVFLWYLCGNSACLMNKRCYSSNAHTFWRNRGLRVVLWTVNDQKEKDYLYYTEKCSIITDTMLVEDDHKPHSS